jgi:hypothetical protein
MSDNHRLLMASIVSVCDRATIDTSKGIARAIFSIIAVSLRYLNRQVLLEGIVPGAYVDWDYVDSAHTILSNKQNLLGDSDIWLQLLPYLNFGKLNLPIPELKKLYPPIWVLYKTLDEHVGHTDMPWGFSDTSKLFLLSNLIGIPFKYVAERYITKSLDHTSHVLCGKIMEAMAEERHEAGVYLESMQYLLAKYLLVPPFALVSLTTVLYFDIPFVTQLHGGYTDHRKSYTTLQKYGFEPRECLENQTS